LKIQSFFIDFIIKEWLLLTSAVSLIITSIYFKHFPSYSIQEFQVLFILFILFITVKGLENSGLILKVSQIIETSSNIPIKLLLMTFFLSMLITNDVTLIIIVPLTLALNITNKGLMVILEALAANIGSALTPLGNPQNLFIYWYYNIAPIDFFKTIFPFSLIFILLLITVSKFVKNKNITNKSAFQKFNKISYIYIALLILILLTVLHILPIQFGIFIIIYVILFDRKSLLIDYSLLLSFFFFFGLAENLKFVLASEINHSGHIFLFSALLSQLMSNVPATLLFAKFTANWKALLWGVNTGGFGSLVGSLANLIAYKIYITNENTTDSKKFTLQFILIGYIAFFLSIGLYFCLN
jgi:Na+/H+ antiporter NhaD/arsenite permease-like protein